MTELVIDANFNIMIYCHALVATKAPNTAAGAADFIMTMMPILTTGSITTTVVVIAIVDTIHIATTNRFASKRVLFNYARNASFLCNLLINVGQA